MIHDTLRNLPKYRGLSPHMDAAIDYITTTNLAALPIGRHSVRGEDIIAIPQEYQSKQPSAAKWEAHRRYVDIQIILAGEERMDVAPIDTMTPANDYDAATDNIFYQPPDDAQLLRVSAGQFTVFQPHDVHAPSLALDEPTTVRKVVFKVRAW